MTEEDYKRVFSRKLQYYMAINQKNQMDLMKDLGISSSTMSSWYNGLKLPRMGKIQMLANYFGINKSDLLEDSDKKTTERKTIRVPVLGSIPAGIPIEAIEEIIDYEEMAYQPGEFFALVVNGDSMEPRIRKGDVVILRKQEDVDSGDVAAVMVNGFDATLKQVKKKGDLLILQSSNPKYEPMIFTKEEREEEPVRILGKLVELRGKY